MQTNFAIVHDLQKIANGPTSLKLKPILLPLDERTQDFAGELLDMYEGKTTKGYGSFDPDLVTYPFSKCLQAFLDQNDAASFVTFTHEAMRILESRISVENMAIGGFVLFVSYSIEGNDFLFITLLRNTQGCVVTKDLEIKITEHLQIDKLHTGCHVDITSWQGRTQNRYITFIKGRSSHTTPAYFLKAIGCAEFTDSVTQTREFIKAILDFADEKQYTAEKKQALKQKVHAYCVESTNIDLEALSVTVCEEDAEDLLSHLSRRDYNVSQGFKPDKRVLKTLKEVSTSGDGIHLKFPLSMFGTRVVLEQTDRGSALRINNPPEKMINDILEASK